VPIAARIGAKTNAIPVNLLLLGVALSVLPDADVLLMRLGVPYDSEFGHRGASHSLAFAFFMATACAVAYARVSKCAIVWPWFYLFVCAASHPLLDTCTNGGHGAAIFWPLSEQRFFAPFRPIEASPLSLRRFFGEPGLRVLVSELLWVWVPMLVLAAGTKLIRKRRGAQR
jgi:inner membrane protein